MPGHSWAVLVLPSPLDDAVLPPLFPTAGRAQNSAPGGLLVPAPRCQMHSRAQTPLIRGWSHSCPCPWGQPRPWGALHHPWGHWRALGGAKVGPCRALGWGFTKSPGVFTVASCLALISSNPLINWCEGWDSKIQPNEVPWEDIPGAWSRGITAAAAVASTQVLQCLQSLRAIPALCSRIPNSQSMPMAWSESQQWA